MNETGGFPFVVARGRVVGQRTIRAPDFLIEAKSSGLLRDSVTDRSGGDESLHIVEVDSSTLGLMTLAYRFTKVASELVYGPENRDKGLLRDRSGRPIEIAYGLVFRGPSSTVKAVDDTRLNALRTEALTVFSEFIRTEGTWTLDSPNVHYPQSGKGSNHVQRPSEVTPANQQSRDQKESTGLWNRFWPFILVGGLVLAITVGTLLILL